MDERTALIIIDMENGFLDPRSAQCMAGAKETVPACAAVAAACRSRNIPVFFVNRIYRPDGSDVEHCRYDSWVRAARLCPPAAPWRYPTPCLRSPHVIRCAARWAPSPLSVRW